MGAVIEARDLSKRFVLYHQGATSLKERFLDLLRRRAPDAVENFWALRHVSLTIERGDAVGLVGRNGSGKSTLLKIIAGIHPPTSGSLRVPRHARIGTMIELGVGFHGDLSAHENVFLNAAIQGLSRGETEAMYPRVVEYSGLAHFMDVPLKKFSSGMYMRLGFAIAANLDPHILLLDEIFAVGDEDFQRQCMRTMQEFADRGTTIVFVSHTPAAVRAICRRVCVLDRGELLFDGAAETGLNHYHRLVTEAPETRPVHAPGPAARLDTSSSEDDLERAWHRVAVGGFWQQAGQWQLEFLKSQGLRPDSFVLDVGCGSLAGARHCLPYMDQDHYWGYEPSRDLYDTGATIEMTRAGVPPERGHFVVNDRFDLNEVPYQFDMAIANSFFRRLPLNSVARCVASVMRKLRPGGRFFVTWFDNPDPMNFDPIPRPRSIESHPDAEPFHYSFEVLAALVSTLGFRAERLPDRSHPRGESVMMISAGASR